MCTNFKHQYRQISSQENNQLTYQVERRWGRQVSYGFCIQRSDSLILALAFELAMHSVHGAFYSTWWWNCLYIYTYVNLIIYVWCFVLIVYRCSLKSWSYVDIAELQLRFPVQRFDCLSQNATCMMAATNHILLLLLCRRAVCLCLTLSLSVCLCLSLYHMMLDCACITTMMMMTIILVISSDWYVCCARSSSVCLKCSNVLPLQFWFKG